MEIAIYEMKRIKAIAIFTAFDVSLSCNAVSMTDARFDTAPAPTRKVIAPSTGCPSAEMTRYTAT